MRQTDIEFRSDFAAASLRSIAPVRLQGRVTGISGLVVEIDGLNGHAMIGDRVNLTDRDGKRIEAEIVAFRDGMAQTMPFAALAGIGPGSTAALASGQAATLAVSDR